MNVKYQNAELATISEHGITDESKGTSGHIGDLQEARRTREKFPETWVWEAIISGYDIYFQK